MSSRVTMRVLRIKEWDTALDDDGIWTLEVLHKTPFGLERLDHVTFGIDRTTADEGAETRALGLDSQSGGKS